MSLSTNRERAQAVAIGCPAASLRSVSIRRHRSPTRANHRSLLRQGLLDFRRTRSRVTGRVVSSDFKDESRYRREARFSFVSPRVTHEAHSQPSREPERSR